MAEVLGERRQGQSVGDDRPRPRAACRTRCGSRRDCSCESAPGVMRVIRDHLLQATSQANERHRGGRRKRAGNRIFEVIPAVLQLRARRGPWRGAVAVPARASNRRTSGYDPATRTANRASTEAWTTIDEGCDDEKIDSGAGVDCTTSDGYRVLHEARGPVGAAGGRGVRTYQGGRGHHARKRSRFVFTIW